MRLLNRKGRLALEVDGRAIDVAERSEGRLPAAPMEAFGVWSELQRFAESTAPRADDPRVAPEELGPPVPSPAQIFAIGLNYRDHAEEASLPIPESPMVFTKFPSCLAGPNADVPLTSDKVDWEVELVAVVGRVAENVSAADAWSHVAGLCCGQDVSDRAMQFKDRPPQFSLGKSARAFGPLGPALVSIDEFSNPDELALRCWIDDALMQDSSTKNLIFSVPRLIEALSAVCPLQPGDLIFTGTPGGVGSVQDPRRYLEVGETIRSEIEGIGGLVNRCVSGA